MARIREYDVKVIRKVHQERLCSSNGIGPRNLIEEIANEFNVKPSCVYRIVQGKTWRHVR
ncbi:hypothetical protein [Cytobacillus pseudoceanisediminis]|uniref:hypothetical protein n=1 Tax=Cytobacillus pseudoceanisediminis TaxID=3051614 RepID=UPI003C300562